MQLQAPSPSHHAFAVAINRAAAMVDDEGLVGEVMRQPGDLLSLVRIEHELEELVVASEQRDAAAEIGLVGDARARGEAFLRLGRMPAQHLSNAHATLDLGQSVKRSARARSGEVSEADIAHSDARRLVERLEPVNLGEWIVGPVPSGFYVHRGDHVLVRRVAQVVIDEIVSSYRVEIAQRLDCASRGTKPGMPVHAEIPKMTMRVDDRPPIQFSHVQMLRGLGGVRNGSSAGDRVGAQSFTQSRRNASPATTLGPSTLRLLRSARQVSESLTY